MQLGQAAANGKPLKLPKSPNEKLRSSIFHCSSFVCLASVTSPLYDALNQTNPNFLFVIDIMTHTLCHTKTNTQYTNTNWFSNLHLLKIQNVKWIFGSFSEMQLDHGGSLQQPQCSLAHLSRICHQLKLAQKHSNLNS